MSETVAIKEAEIGTWETDFPRDEDKQSGNGERKRIEWMKFTKPGDYTIRLVGKYVKFLRHWDPFDDKVVTHPDYKDADPAWKAGFYPRKTFAVHVIDRADGKLKILEKGASIFKYFSRFRTINDVDPGGKDAPNFTITVEWPQGNKNAAKYTVMAAQKPAPLTEQEKEMVRDGKAPLTKIYAATPLEKIIEMWAAIPDKNKVPKKRDGAAKGKDGDEAEVGTEDVPAVAEELEEKMTDSPADNDEDLFGSTDKGGNEW